MQTLQLSIQGTDRLPQAAPRANVVPLVKPSVHGALPLRRVCAFRSWVRHNREPPVCAQPSALAGPQPF